MTEELLSQEKFEELTKELEELRTTRRKEVAEQLEYARSLGDLSENAEYQEAREMQGAVEDRINKLESVLKNAKIVHGTKKTDTISMGSTVTVQKVDADEKHTYIIVGAEETNMFEGKIYHSPLGNALMGKKKGDQFSFHTPRGTQKYKILKVD